MRALRNLCNRVLAYFFGQDRGETFAFFHNDQVWVSAPMWVHEALVDRMMEERCCNLCFDDYDKFLDIIEELNIQVVVNDRFSESARRFMTEAQIERLFSLREYRKVA